MKEGLRSGNMLAKPETDKVLPRRGRKGNAIKQQCSDLNDEVAQRTDSDNEECVEDGLYRTERKRSRVDCVTAGNEGDSLVKKRVKEGGQMRNSGRVLRSQSRVESEKEGNKGNIEDKKRSRESDGGYEKESDVVDMGIEESDQLDDGKARKKVKGKRGRPPKAPKNDDSRGVERKKLKVKRGRPPKEKIDESFMVERKKAKNKRGRPRNKQQDNDESDHSRSKRLKGKLGRPPKDQGTNKVLKTNFGKEKKINGSRITGGVKFKKQGEKHMETNQGKSVGSTRTEKQLVRDRIIEHLLGAGWTIEYRPRFGRDYNDSVYVNPEGKTFWSVTLAYRVLKNDYEEEGGNSKTSNTGFTFTPIPEDELKILNREVHKVRCDKNKKRSKKKLRDADTNDELVVGRIKNKQQLHKGKPNSAASSGGKSLKRGTKGKPSHGKQDNSISKNRKQQGTQNRKRCGLLVRKSVEGAECDGYVPYDGKRTVLAWMIDLGIVPLNGKVEYCNRRKTRVIHKGMITRDGIRCDCCGEIFSISKFETHAGAGTNLCYPFQNLYLESGTPFLQCVLDSWNKQDESERKGFHFVDVGGEDPNDDTCGICGDGGDLICCDGCPSTFHQSCLDIKRFPSGKWNCVYCSCKFCGVIDKNTCQMVDHDDSAISALLICSLCEEKYHQSCIQAEDALNDNPSRPFFCGKKCQQIFERLQMLLGVKHELDEGYTWTFICRADVSSNPSLDHECQKVECNAKLAVALLVMDECFLPMPDYRSGINLIHNIVYNFGSNFSRLNYRGFFTAILERDDEIISAASIRIHGNELAEMPFIGTRYMYRRQGMCRRLLTGIESALCSLNVERLVIPAITELKETWTSVFGFKPVEISSRQKMRNMNLLAFPGVDMLEKPVLKNQFAVESKIPAEVEHQNKEISGPGGEFKSENVIIKHNNFGDEATAHQSAEKTTDNQNLDSGENYFTHEAEAKCPMTDVEVTAGCGTRDDVQENDKIVTDNPPGFVSDADEENKEPSDCGDEFRRASKLPTKSTSNVELEDVIVKRNIGDEASAHQSAEKTTDNQNSDSGENYFTHEAEANCLVTDEPEVTAACGTHDDVQENDESVIDNPLGFVSDADGEDKESTDCGDDFPHASKLPTKSTSNFVLEDVIVKHNNIGDEVSEQYHLVENNTTDAQNFDLLQGSKVSGQIIFTHESGAKYPTTDDTVEVTTTSFKTVVEESNSPPEEESCSLDGNPVAGRSQMNAETSEHLGSDSESLRESSPGTSVAPHCSSGGGNACATTETIILSNQAS